MSAHTQRLEEILSMRYEDWPEEFEAIEQLIREAEGRGRVSVLSAVKEWADDVEVTWNKLFETELDKLEQLKQEARGK